MLPSRTSASEAQACAARGLAGKPSGKSRPAAPQASWRCRLADAAEAPIAGRRIERSRRHNLKLFGRGSLGVVGDNSREVAIGRRMTRPTRVDSNRRYNGDFVTVISKKPRMAGRCCAQHHFKASHRVAMSQKKVARHVQAHRSAGSA